MIAPVALRKVGVAIEPPKVTVPAVPTPSAEASATRSKPPTMVPEKVISPAFEPPPVKSLSAVLKAVSVTFFLK